mmetsp:Transcript_6244/g.12838  ORF Transcript_6244/g.12838 Transcript_6244/m.12838 type:complete len:529 (+) Transcript_6244:135-1721(+)
MIKRDLRHPRRGRRRHPAAATPRSRGRFLLQVAIFVCGFLISGFVSVFIYLRVTSSPFYYYYYPKEQSNNSILRQRKRQHPLHSRISQKNHPDNQQDRNSSNNHHYSNNKNQNWLNPKSSHPPQAMDLSQLLLKSDLPAWQQNRYKCLQNIRQRQDQVMQQIQQQQHVEVVLIDPAYHANVGDHMISVAEQSFLQKLQQHQSEQTIMKECSYFQAGPWAPPCSQLLKASRTLPATTTSKKLAVWHGGGNWGDLWDTIHHLRTQSMTLLLQYNYIIWGMPQSLYFGNPDAATSNTKQFRQAVVDGLMFMPPGNRQMSDRELETALHGRLFLTWREEESYRRAQQLYPYAKHIIMPDIAFQLGPYNASRITAMAKQEQQPQVDLLFFLRNDVESLYANVRNRQSIRQLLSQQLSRISARFTYSIVDWQDRLDRFEDTDYYFTDTAIQLLNSGKVLVCDRLHAAILAYLAGIPFVFVDQVSGKITKTFLVMQQGNGDDSSCVQPAMWTRADNLTDAVPKAAFLWEEFHDRG